MAPTRTASRKRNPWLRQPRILVLATTLVCGIVAVCVAMKPETREGAGRRLVDCTLDGDAPCLLRYMTVDERETLQLGESNVKSFLNRVVLPNLRGFSKDGPPSIESTSAAGTVYQKLRNPDGRITLLTFPVIQGPEGPRVCGMIVGLLVAAYTARWPVGKAYPMGRDKAAFWGQSTEDLMSDLQACGVGGVLLGVPPTEKHYTWAEYREYLRARSERN